MGDDGGPATRRRGAGAGEQRRGWRDGLWLLWIRRARCDAYQRCCAWLWFCLAFAIGLVLARRWALLLAPSPTIAFWYNVSTGRRPRLSDAWEVGAIVITAIGLVGIALGLVVGRGLSKAGLWR